MSAAAGPAIRCLPLVLPSRPRRFQRYAPPRTLSQREVTLAYLGPSTWMPVRRQSAISSLRLTLSGSSEWRTAREVRARRQRRQLWEGEGVHGGWGSSVLQQAGGW